MQPNSVAARHAEAYSLPESNAAVTGLTFLIEDSFVNIRINFFRTSALAAFLILPFTAGCGTPSASKTEDVGDALSIVRRSDGSFDIKCRDGHTEVKTEAEVRSGDICQRPVPQPLPEDPWNPAFCQGPPLTKAAALARIPLPNGDSFTAKTLGYLEKARLCVDADGCTEWNVFPSWTGVNPSPDLFLSNNWTVLFPFATTRAGSVRIETNSNLHISLIGNEPFLAVHLDTNDASGSIAWSLNEGASPDLQLNGLRARSENGVLRPLTWTSYVGFNCMRMAAENQYPVKLSSGNTGRVEEKYVIYSRFDE